jgi:heptosyltransferase I
MTKRVLIIRLGAMGDVLHASASLQLIPPDAGVEIHWLTSPLYAPLLAHIAAPHKPAQLWGWDKSGGWSAYWQLINTLRQQDFDTVINLHPSFKTRLLARLVATSVWTYRKQKLPLTGRAVRALPRRHAVDDFAQPVRQWLTSTAHKPVETVLTPKLALSQPDLSTLELSKLELPKLSLPPANTTQATNTTVIGIIPGVGNKRSNRAMPLDHWQQLLSTLHNTYPHAVFAVFGGAEDTPLSQQLQTYAQKHDINLLDHTNQWAIVQTAALMQQCLVIIGGDTGPTHLAAAAGCTVISPFGPTDARRSGPVGPHTHPLSPDPTLACWPCEKPTCALPQAEQLSCLHLSKTRVADIQQVIEHCLLNTAY